MTVADLRCFLFELSTLEKAADGNSGAINIQTHFETQKFDQYSSHGRGNKVKDVVFSRLLIFSRRAGEQEKLGRYQ